MNEQTVSEVSAVRAQRFIKTDTKHECVSNFLLKLLASRCVRSG